MGLKETFFGSVKKAAGSCEIVNRLGLHARPACIFVQKASEFKSSILVSSAACPEPADGKSLMSMLMLAAACGSRIKIVAEGDDAEEALTALRELIESGFDEE